ncbi:hypothetical protein U1Q18_005982 [Sarracenia purpurea var. burkii]
MFFSSISLSTPFFPKIPFASPSSSPPPSFRYRKSRLSGAYTAAAAADRTSSHIATTPSYYEVLGIHTNATGQEIKTAYRRLARVSHPDVASNGDKATSAAEFIRIRTAYATLFDAEKRAEYDRHLFWRRQTVPTSPFARSPSASAVASPLGTGFSGYTRRRWETDQCW